MQVQVQTDEHIHGGESLHQWAQEQAQSRLSRFQEHVTRLEVHFSDVDAGKSHNDNRDKRCVMEARPAGRQPVAVTAEAASVAEAFTSACDKLTRALETDIGRLRDKNGRDTIRAADSA